MDNFEEYIKVFEEVLQISREKISNNLKIRSVNTWDSIGHMSLISKIEDTFEIFFDTEDILGFDSFEKGIELLKKYDVEI